MDADGCLCKDMFGPLLTVGYKTPKHLERRKLERILLLTFDLCVWTFFLCGSVNGRLFHDGLRSLGTVDRLFSIYFIGFSANVLISFSA